MFSGAANVQINGGSFQVVHVTNCATELDILRQHSALNALLNSKERFDPPRCDENTRVAIIQEIMDWVVGGDDSEASMMVLLGSAGAGKSALGQSIAEKCLQEGRLAATFFLSGTVLNRTNGDALIPTLAYQLAKNDPDVGREIALQVGRDRDILQMNSRRQFLKLIVKPYQSLSESLEPASKKARLIVIDGLDECNDPNFQVLLLRVIAGNIPNIPFPLRFLIASRPESHILDALDTDKMIKDIPLHRIDLSEDRSADKDIKQFLVNEFQKIRQFHPIRAHLPELWPTPDDLTTLIKRASRQFIFASAAITYIKSRKHRPDDRLQVILGLAPAHGKDKPFAQLDALYSHIFSFVEDTDLVLRILGFIYLATHHRDELDLCTKYWHTSPANIEDVFDLKPGDVQLAFDDMFSLVGVIDRNSPIRIYHASLFDFLLDKDRSGPLVIDFALIHEALANRYWKDIEITSNNFRFNLPSGKNGNEDALRSALSFLTHCHHARLSPQIMQYLQSPLLLPFHERFFAKSIWSTPEFSPIDRTWMEWTIFGDFEFIYKREDCTDSQFGTYIMDSLNNYCDYLLKRSPIQELLQPFADRLQPLERQDSCADPTVPRAHHSNHTAVRQCQFSTLMSWISSGPGPSPDIRYARAVVTSCELWSPSSCSFKLKNLCRRSTNWCQFEEMARASFAFAINLLPLAGYYPPLVEMLAHSTKPEFDKWALINERKTTKELSYLLASYVERYKCHIDTRDLQILRRKGYLSRNVE